MDREKAVKAVEKLLDALGRGGAREMKEWIEKKL